MSLSLVEGETDGENEGDDCDEVICAGWGEPGGEWTQWGWRNDEGSWFHRWGDALEETVMIGSVVDVQGLVYFNAIPVSSMPVRRTSLHLANRGDLNHQYW